MIGKYSVTYNGKTVGNAEVSREGLYYRIRCSCTLADGKIYRVLLSNTSLGVMVPEDSKFVLNIRRPVKQFDIPTPVFSVSDGNDHWHPVCGDRSFLHLDKLGSAVFQIREGIPGILLINQAANQPGSGLNP